MTTSHQEKRLALPIQQSLSERLKDGHLILVKAATAASEHNLVRRG